MRPQATSAAAPRRPPSATASRARRPSCRPCATPPTTAPTPPTTRTERATRDEHRLQREPPSPGSRPRRRRRGRRSNDAPESRHPRADPAAAPRPLARLHHRRPGRARLRDARRPCRRRSRQARTAGRTPESLLLEQGAINSDQLSRAIAERYGLDHVDLSDLPGRHGRRGAVPGDAWRAATRRCRSASSTSRRCWSPTADPANVLAVDDIQIATGLDCRIAVAAEEDVEALLAPPRHAAERRRRGDHRGRGRGRGRGGRASPRSARCRPAPRTRR